MKESHGFEFVIKSLVIDVFFNGYVLLHLIMK